MPGRWHQSSDENINVIRIGNTYVRIDAREECDDIGGVCDDDDAAFVSSALVLPTLPLHTLGPLHLRSPFPSSLCECFCNSRQ